MDSKKMTEKDWIKSVFKAEGIANLTKMDTTPREKYVKRDGKLQCPNCYAVGSNEIDKMRDCFFYCRVCGYENDERYFLTNEHRRSYHKKLKYLETYYKRHPDRKTVR